MIQRNAAKASTIIQFGVLAIDNAIIKDFITDVLIGSGFERVKEGGNVSVLDKYHEGHGIFSIVLKLSLVDQLDQRKMAYEKQAIDIPLIAQSS